MFPPTPQGVKVRDGKYFFEKSASQENLACLSNQALPSNFYTQIFVKNIKYQKAGVRKILPASATRLSLPTFTHRYSWKLSYSTKWGHNKSPMHCTVLLTLQYIGDLLQIARSRPNIFIQARIFIISQYSSWKMAIMERSGWTGKMGDELNSLPLMCFNLLEPSPIKKLRYSW